MTFPFLLKKLKYYYKKNEFDEDAWKDLTEDLAAWNNVSQQENL